MSKKKKKIPSPEICVRDKKKEKKEIARNICLVKASFEKKIIPKWAAYIYKCSFLSFFLF